MLLFAHVCSFISNVINRSFQSIFYSGVKKRHSTDWMNCLKLGNANQSHPRCRKSPTRPWILKTEFRRSVRQGGSLASEPGIWSRFWTSTQRAAFLLAQRICPVISNFPRPSKQESLSQVPHQKTKPSPLSIGGLGFALHHAAFQFGIYR